MARRKRMNWKKSRRDFVKKSGVHPKNGLPEGSTPAMRGGIRL